MWQSPLQVLKFAGYAFAALILVAGARSDGGPAWGGQVWRNDGTARSLADLCTTRDRHSQDFCVLSISQVVEQNEQLTALANELGRLNLPVVVDTPACVKVPAQTTLEELKLNFLDWLSRHTEMATAPNQRAVLAALNEAFPC